MEELRNKRIQVFLTQSQYKLLKKESDKQQRKPANLAALWIADRCEELKHEQEK